MVGKNTQSIDKIRQTICVSLGLLCCAVIMLPGPAIAASAPQYLAQESFTLPLDGTEIVTSSPLHDQKVYHIRVSSPYHRDLRMLRGVCLAQHNGTWHTMQWWLNCATGRYASAILLDQWPVDALSASGTDSRDSLTFLYRGTGQPLSLRLVKNYASEIGLDALRIDIAVASWWERIDWDFATNIFAWILMITLFIGIVLLVGYSFEQERKEREQEQARKTREREREQQEELRQQMAALRRRVHAEPFLDPAYRKRFAESNVRHIHGGQYGDNKS